MKAHHALLIFIFLVFTLSGCHSNNPNNATSSDATKPPSNTSIKSLQDIVGYVLSCETPKGEAFVYVFAPHILGIWADPVDKTIEYFVSQFVTKNNELAYESLIVGKVNMQTTLGKLGNLENRRIMMKIKDGKIHLMVAFGLSSKDKTPIHPQQYACNRVRLISQTFDSNRAN